MMREVELKMELHDSWGLVNKNRGYVTSVRREKVSSPEKVSLQNFRRIDKQPG